MSHSQVGQSINIFSYPVIGYMSLSKLGDEPGGEAKVWGGHGPFGSLLESSLLSLSKQHNKMLKIKSEMLKIKNVKIIKLEKISLENFPNPGNPEDFWEIF